MTKPNEDERREDAAEQQKAADPNAETVDREENTENVKKDAEAKGTAEEAGADGGEKPEDAEGAGKDDGESPEEAEAPKEEDEELQTRYLRLAADFQNYKRRSEKEKSDIYARANEKLVTELLDVMDNFERAMAAGSDCSDKGFAEGMEMIFKQFKGVLEKNGLKEIQAEGEVFDPNFHHAVMMEGDTGKESGTVTGVLQKGYLLNDRVIRPAMVKVAE